MFKLKREGRVLKPPSVALFIFFTATTRARIVSSYFRGSLYGSSSYRFRTHISFVGCVIFSCLIYFLFIYMHFTHVSLLRYSLCSLWWFLNRNTSSNQEGYNVAVSFQQHLSEEIESFKLINQERIFLFIRSHSN